MDSERQDAPAGDADTSRAVVPAGPGDHWQTIAAYLNEDGDGAERVDGEPLTIDARYRDVTPHAGDGDDDDDEGNERKPPSPGAFGPLGPAGERVRTAYLRTAGLPTPGGVGMLIFALVVFGFAIIAVGPNGETRLQLIWGTVTGTVTIPSKYDVGGQIGAFIQNVKNLENANSATGAITGGVQGILHDLGIGAGPGGMPGYDQGSASGAGGLDGYSRIY